MVGADLRHFVLTERQQHFAQVAVVQQRTPLLGVQTKMRRLSGLRVRRRNARAQTLAKISGNSLVVRKGILVYVDLPADTAVFRAVRADAPECLVIRRTANVAHPNHLSCLSHYSRHGRS